MEKIISGIYEILATIFVLMVKIPGGTISEEPGVLFFMTFLLAVSSIIILFLAVRANCDKYDFYVKLAVGGILIFVIAHCAVLEISGLDILKTVPLYGSVAAGMLLAGAIAFAVINFMLDPKKGKVTIFVWLSEMLFACSVIRLWGYVKGTDGIPQYGKIMLAERIKERLPSLFNRLGLGSLIGICEYALLIAMMFIITYYLFRTRKFLEKEWLGCVVSQILSGFAYLLYESHDGIAWRMDQAFIIFLMFCTGEMLYLFLFMYEKKCKDQKRCRGAIFAGVSGALWHCVAVIAVDMTRRGAMSKSLTRLSEMMTWIYKVMPVGVHTDFGKGNSFIALFGALIAIVLSAIVLVVLFIALARGLDYEGEGAGMGVVWFRNCSMVMMIPVVICWICYMYGNIFGNSYKWISLMLQSLVSIGSALCISNITPAFKKGFLGQLKLIAVSLAGSLASVCILVPIILALI